MNSTILDPKCRQQIIARRTGITILIAGYETGLKEQKEKLVKLQDECQHPESKDVSTDLDVEHVQCVDCLKTLSFGGR